jgi:hypothetical protein
MPAGPRPEVRCASRDDPCRFAQMSQFGWLGWVSPWASVKVAPASASEVRYGASPVPTTSVAALFLKTTTTTWSGVGTLPSDGAVAVGTGAVVAVGVPELGGVAWLVAVGVSEPVEQPLRTSSGAARLMATAANRRGRGERSEVVVGRGIEGGVLPVSAGGDGGGVRRALLVEAASTTAPSPSRRFRQRSRVTRLPVVFGHRARASCARAVRPCRAIRLPAVTDGEVASRPPVPSRERPRPARLLRPPRWGWHRNAQAMRPTVPRTHRRTRVASSSGTVAWSRLETAR